MRKSGVIISFLVVAILLISSFAFVSAGLWSDFWNKITGNPITGKVIYGPTNGLVGYWPLPARR